MAESDEGRVEEEDRGSSTSGGGTSQGRLVVVSNRLPIVLTRKSGGGWNVEPGSGGLVTAMAPVLRNRGGLWIGWPGTTEWDGVEDALRKLDPSTGYSLIPVRLTREEEEKYYRGFANEVVWPLFHDLQSHCNFDPAYWDTYQNVNRKFAEVVAQHTGPQDFVWIHDYHLLLAATELRAMGVKSKLGYFLHIPFPPLDIFVKMPWRLELLLALLQYDIIGFQTMRDRRNFLQCLRALVGAADLCGRGQVCDIELEHDKLRLGAFPISIDYKWFASRAGSKEVAESAWHVHENLPDRKIVLGIDRMDYTKGIPYRLEAFRHLLRTNPELRNKLTLVQVVVPSRRGIPEYDALKTHIERLVGEINGEFTSQSGWVPIHYSYRSLDHYELLGYYRACEIALITPIKDGMNLVAKEYCASNIEENGVLILSEFAGAAAELQKGALLVNPYDVVRMSEAISRAYHMKPDERHARMRRLRRSVRKRDIFWWVDSFLEAAIAKNLDSFPVIADYVPDGAPDI
ncbi:MAG: trehalose-6-phosphate synthase [Candidatus Eisenbacteria bacterium]|nr:trehalose-6-phosphate synthase [Candidatus Eisenbacteria bacterium]